jgi:protein TonB
MAPLIPTRHSVEAAGKLGSGFAGSFVLHAAAALALVVWAFFSHAGQKWGSADATAGSIQATMVSSIPLPPKVPTADQNNVLATERPSVAPAPPAAPAVQAPKPDAIPIPTRQTKVPPTPKQAEKTTPAPPKQIARTTPSVSPSMHPVVPTQPVNKAVTGETSGIRTAMSSVQNRAGTSSINVADQAFGARFGYYVQLITQKVAQQWYTSLLDQNAPGHRVYINFDIQRDGTPSNIRIAQPSGDTTLDQTALSAVRHIDTFPPLPDAYAGSHINVTYYFDPQPHP